MGIKLVSDAVLVPLVYKGDDAIDLENSDLKKYQETAEISHLKFLPDMEPAKFFCGALDGLQGDELSKMEGTLYFGGKVESEDDAKAFKTNLDSTGKQKAYFRACVKKITGIPSVRLEPGNGFDKRGKKEIVGDLVLKALPWNVVIYIGGLCQKVNTVEERDAKNSPPR